MAKHIRNRQRHAMACCQSQHRNFYPVERIFRSEVNQSAACMELSTSRRANQGYGYSLELLQPTRCGCPCIRFCKCRLWRERLSLVSQYGIFTLLPALLADLHRLLQCCVLRLVGKAVSCATLRCHVGEHLASNASLQSSCDVPGPHCAISFRG